MAKYSLNSIFPIQQEYKRKHSLFPNKTSAASQSYDKNNDLLFQAFPNIVKRRELDQAPGNPAHSFGGLCTIIVQPKRSQKNAYPAYSL